MFKFLIFIFLIIMSIFFTVRAEDEVVLLNDENFNSNVQKFDICLVMFYAPWCPYCKQFLPTFSKAARILKNDHPSMKLVQVDCTTSGKKTCSKQQIKGYPTLKIFKNGVYSSEYQGERSVNGLVSFMKSMVSN